MNRINPLFSMRFGGFLGNQMEILNRYDQFFYENTRRKVAFHIAAIFSWMVAKSDHRKKTQGKPKKTRRQQNEGKRNSSGPH